MSFLSSCVVLAIACVCLLSSTASAQNYSGTATCNFTTLQLSIDGTGVATNTGYLTINLTAASYVVPNTPGFAGQKFLSYPIINMQGQRTFIDVDGASPVFSDVIGIGTNRTIYLTFDPSDDLQGYPSDAGYQYRFDYTGIDILTDDSTTPTVRFAEVNTQPSAQYSELALFSTGLWENASFSLMTCVSNYTVDVVTSPTSGSSSSSTGVASSASSSSGGRGGQPGTGAIVVGDPSFVGFLGQSYQIHGMADTVYSVISDAQVQLNALFVFLNAGQCPTVDGKRLTNCWSHPGSYFGSIALQTAEGDRLLITSGSYTQGMTMTLNDQPLTASVSRSGLTVSVDNSFRVTIEAGLYRMVIENSDMFLNIAGIQVSDWQKLTKEAQPHGLLGQTWSRTRRSSPVEGTVDDYAEADNALFGSKFLYNKFGSQ